MYMNHTSIIKQSTQRACLNVDLTNILACVSDVSRRYCPILQNEPAIFCPVILDWVDWVAAQLLMLN